MDIWEVKKPETADAIIAAMNAGNCGTNEDVENIAAQHGESVYWFRRRKERENEADF